MHKQKWNKTYAKTKTNQFLDMQNDLLNIFILITLSPMLTPLISNKMIAVQLHFIYVKCAPSFLIESEV